MGLTGKETVVVYESGFGMRAARVGWMLAYAGIDKVFLLEGGFRAWRKSHFPTQKRLAKPSHQAFQVKPVSTILASANQIRARGSTIVLDVRTEGEFAGKDGRECDRRRGRIPRARWLEWNDFILDGKRFKTRSEIASVLKKKGLSKNRSEIVTYCHRGARAAVAYYGLRALGFENVRNYIGSWHEWSARNDLPVER